MNPRCIGRDAFLYHRKLLEFLAHAFLVLGSWFAQSAIVIVKEEAMNLFRSTTAKVFIACFALIGLQAYGFMSMRHSFQDRMSALENQIQDVQSARVQKVISLRPIWTSLPNELESLHRNSKKHTRSRNN